MKNNLLCNKNSQIKQQIEEWVADGFDKNICPKIPIVENIDPEIFAQEHVIKNKPVILKGILDSWPARKKWDFDFFANNFGDVKINANLYDKSKIQSTTLKEMIDQIKANSSPHPLYLQEWWFQENCQILLDDIIIPKHFSDDQNLGLLGFHNSTLWIGQKGAFTPIHQDTVFSNVWTAQIKGRKEWILFDKNAQIYPKDGGNPDFEQFMQDRSNNVLIGEIEEGDILYVPYKWWHRALTMENAISVNTFYISQEIASPYIKDVLSIPMAMSLNRELLAKYDPMRYNITMSRIRILAKMLKMNPDNILGIETDEDRSKDAKLIDEL